MLTDQPAGYRERPHTADWALDVWAPDLATLLQQAAMGMNALMGLQLRSDSRITRRLDLPAADRETLLVSFLTELLYFAGRDDVGFDAFDLTLNGDRLAADLSGAPIEAQAKEIKAVTYHNLEIRQTERGLEATIVFDV